MGPFLCMQWVRKYGGNEFDYITNLNVVEHVADKALEVAYSDEDVRLCKAAKEAATLQIREYERASTTTQGYKLDPSP